MQECSLALQTPYVLAVRFGSSSTFSYDLGFETFPFAPGGLGHVSEIGERLFAFLALLRGCPGARGHGQMKLVPVNHFGKLVPRRVYLMSYTIVKLVVGSRRGCPTATSTKPHHP